MNDDEFIAWIDAHFPHLQLPDIRLLRAVILPEDKKEAGLPFCRMLAENTEEQVVAAIARLRAQLNNENWP